MSCEWKAELMGKVSDKMVTDGEFQQHESERQGAVWQDVIDLCEKTLSGAGINSGEIVRKVRSLQDIAEQFWTNLDGRQFNGSLAAKPHDSWSFELLIADLLAIAIRVTVSSEAFDEYIAAQDEHFAEAYLASIEGIEDAELTDEG